MYRQSKFIIVVHIARQSGAYYHIFSSLCCYFDSLLCCCVESVVMFYVLAFFSGSVCIVDTVLCLLDCFVPLLTSWLFSVMLSS